MQEKKVRTLETSGGEIVFLVRYPIVNEWHTPRGGEEGEGNA